MLKFKMKTANKFIKASLEIEKLCNIVNTNVFNKCWHKLPLTVMTLVDNKKSYKSK